MILNKFQLMNEAIGGDVGGTGGAPATPPVEPTNLPSDAGQDPTPVGFQINPEALQDGKFMGKWESPEAMADHIKEMEDKYANLKRDISDQTKQTEQEIEAQAQAAQAEQTKINLVRELTPEFIDNGMVVTDEMRQKLTDAGITETEIKLGAYEMKEALDRNASYVGGKENYDIIMDFHAQNMTDDEKIAFNESIQNPKNHQALMVGLQALYEKHLSENPDAANDQIPQGRLRGNAPANTNSIQPYASKAELLKDKAYADSRQASAADKAKYRARLAATPDSVWRQ